MRSPCLGEVCILCSPKHSQPHSALVGTRQYSGVLRSICKVFYPLTACERAQCESIHEYKDVWVQVIYLEGLSETVTFLITEEVCKFHERTSYQRHLLPFLLRPVATTNECTNGPSFGFGMVSFFWSRACSAHRRFLTDISLPHKEQSRPIMTLLGMSRWILHAFS